MTNSKSNLKKLDKAINLVTQLSEDRVLENYESLTNSKSRKLLGWVAGFLNAVNNPVAVNGNERVIEFDLN